MFGLHSHFDEGAALFHYLVNESVKVTAPQDIVYETGGDTKTPGTVYQKGKEKKKREKKFEKRVDKVGMMC